MNLQDLTHENCHLGPFFEWKADSANKKKIKKIYIYIYIYNFIIEKHPQTTLKTML